MPRFRDLYILVIAIVGLILVSGAWAVAFGLGWLEPGWPALAGAALSISAVGSTVVWWALWRLRVSFDLVSEDVAQAIDSLGSKVKRRKPKGHETELRRAVDDLIRALNRSVNKVQREKERLMAVLETMEASVLVVNDQHRLTLVNRAARIAFNIPESVKGRSVSEVFSTPLIKTLVTQCLAEMKPKRREISFEVDDDIPRELVLQATPLTARPGCIVLVHDVTELRRLERVRRDFVSNVSHDLKTPVAVIQANAETLLSGAIDDKAHATEFIHGIMRNSGRLSEQIEEIMVLARLEGDRMPTRREPINLTELVDGISDRVGALAGSRNQNVQAKLAPGLVVMGDSGALTRSLLNLIENAVKYTPVGGTIQIGAKRQGDEVLIQVEDDGPGIPAEFQQRVFERFFRVDPARARSTGGSGLGLAIVKHLVQAMGGEVGVGDSSLGGAQFWLSLPIEKTFFSDETPNLISEEIGRSI